jgi:UPF0716 protein FxsA
MPALLFLVYLVAEIAALVALAHAVGVLWTVVIVIAVWVLGLRLARAQGRRALDGLRAASRGEREPGGALADSGLIAVGSLLMFIPGLVTSAVGALLLLPPTRVLARPLAALLVSRRLGMLSTASIVFGGRGAGGPDVIDGEVVDSRYEDTPRLG